MLNMITSKQVASFENLSGFFLRIQFFFGKYFFFENLNVLKNRIFFGIFLKVWNVIGNYNFSTKWKKWDFDTKKYQNQQKQRLQWPKKLKSPIFFSTNTSPWPAASRLVKTSKTEVTMTKKAKVSFFLSTCSSTWPCRFAAGKN